MLIIFWTKYDNSKHSELLRMRHETGRGEGVFSLQSSELSYFVQKLISIFLLNQQGSDSNT